MELSRLLPLLALLLAASLHTENTHKKVRIASPWPVQDTIIAMLGYDDSIVGTSMIAKRIPLFHQSLPRIEKVAAVSVNNGRETNPEQIIALGVDMLFAPQNMVAPQQALLKQAGVQVLAFKASSLWVLTQRVQQTAVVLGSDAQQKALVYQRCLDRNAALVTGRLKDLPASQHVLLYHGMGNPPITTGRPLLNQDWIDLAGGKSITEDWFGEHQQSRSGEVALEKIVTASPAVIIAINKRDAGAALSSPQWVSMDTVIHHYVCVNPKGMFQWCRETSEEALQFLWLVKTLYLARFADMDIRKGTHEFYRQFFDLTLSDAQINDALNSPHQWKL